MIVVDASVVVSALGDDGPDGARARKRLKGETLVAPELIDIEVVSAWRRLLPDESRGAQALIDFRRLRIARAPHMPLLDRCWELKGNLTPYDAAYVALAERLAVNLLTGDRKLANATGPRCQIELIS